MQRQRIVLIVLVSVVLALVGAFLGWLKWLEYDGKRITEENSLADVEARVTPEEFEKIQLGMTLDEVEKIIGGEGKVSYESEYSIEYSWPGEYYVDEPFDYRLEGSFRKEDKTLYGMSYSEVASILGGDGVQISETRYITSRGSEEPRETETSTHASYVWKCIRKKDGGEWIVVLGFRDGELSLATDPLQELMIE